VQWLDCCQFTVTFVHPFGVLIDFRVSCLRERERERGRESGDLNLRYLGYGMVRIYTTPAKLNIRIYKYEYTSAPIQIFFMRVPTSALLSIIGVTPWSKQIEGLEISC